MDMGRYMDDGRAFLPPVKPGLRVGEDGGLKFCKRWEKEDQKLCPMERTRRVIHETLVGVEEYLVFTTETSEDFKDGWLPTLDTSVKVDNNNQVLFTYYEKPTTAKRTVMKRSAMAEKATIQVHSNDPIRRFMNTREDLPDGDFCKMNMHRPTSWWPLCRTDTNGGVSHQIKGPYKEIEAHTWFLH